VAGSFAIHEGEVDGVPAMWTESSTPFMAGLMFRVGRADEVPAQGGITHLVEHLVLAPLGIPDYDHNAFVEPLRTVFHASGDEDEVVAFLDGVTRALSDLPTERLLTERSILRREFEENGPGLGTALRWYRYGASGHGLVHEPEFGLGWLGPDLVRPWAAERFVRRNATLVMNGPPPPGLRLHLRDGERREVTPPSVAPYLQLPAHASWNVPGVAMTFSTPREPAANMVANVLHRRLRTRLRFDLGAVYDVYLDYERLAHDTSHVAFGTDCDERNVAKVQTTLVEIADELARSGPTAAELASEITGLRRGFDIDDGRFGYVTDIAFDRLIGGPAPLPDELVAQRQAVGPDDAARSLAGALGNLIVFGPGDNPIPDRLAAIPVWSGEEVAGNTSSPAGFHLPGRGPRERLIVGPDGVTLRVSPTERLTVRYDACIAAVHEGDTRTLVGRDGIRVHVDAAAWRDGAALLERIDAGTPTDRFACPEHSPGGLAEPDVA
jgi:hypothetical protein